MAGKKRKDVRDQDITGLKYFDKLLPLFEPLHEVGCQRDKAGNRENSSVSTSPLKGLTFTWYRTRVAIYRVIWGRLLTIDRWGEAPVGCVWQFGSSQGLYGNMTPDHR